MALISIRLETGLAPGFTAGQMYRMRSPYARNEMPATCGHLMGAVNVNREVNLQALQGKQSGEPKPGAIFWSK